jgi:hypothetical protein
MELGKSKGVMEESGIIRCIRICRKDNSSKKQDIRGFRLLTENREFSFSFFFCFFSFFL